MSLTCCRNLESEYDGYDCGPGTRYWESGQTKNLPPKTQTEVVVCGTTERYEEPVKCTECGGAVEPEEDEDLLYYEWYYMPEYESGECPFECPYQEEERDERCFDDCQYSAIVWYDETEGLYERTDWTCFNCTCLAESLFDLGYCFRPGELFQSLKDYGKITRSIKRER